MLIGVYKMFIGLLLAAFVGVGIAAFSPEPKFPDPPFLIEGPALRDGELSPEAQRQREEYQRLTREFREQSAAYSRNVATIAAAAGILLLVISLTVLRTTPIFSDGFLLGGILTFLYSIARGFGADDNMFRFVIIGLGLIIALVLGYVRFGLSGASASGRSLFAV